MASVVQQLLLYQGIVVYFTGTFEACENIVLQGLFGCCSGLDRDAIPLLYIDDRATHKSTAVKLNAFK